MNDREPSFGKKKGREKEREKGKATERHALEGLPIKERAQTKRRE